MSHYRRVRKNLHRALYPASPRTDEALAGKCLMENMSYRLPRNADSDPFIGFREWWRMLRRPLSHSLPLSQKAKNVLLVSGKAQANGATEYVQAASGVAVDAVLQKDDLRMALSPADQWSDLFFCLIVSFRCVFSKQRANQALLIRQVHETTALVTLLEAFGAQHLFNFIPFEVDTNLISLLCKDQGVTTTLIPSAGPLQTHNHTLIADELIVSTPYHLEELRVLGDQVRVQRITRWMPERTQQFFRSYFTTPEPPVRTLGFYSHGSWLRELQQHAENGLGIAEAEEQLTKDVGAFLKKHPEFTMIIFAHPREKQPALLAQTEAHYRRYFDLDGGQVRLASIDEKTPFCFHMVDVAVAAFSTVQYERLFCGYKMLIGVYGIKGFPMPGSSLAAICFHDGHTMEQIILRSAEMNRTQFFEQFGLDDYTMHSPLVKLPGT